VTPIPSERCAHAAPIRDGSRVDKLDVCCYHDTVGARNGVAGHHQGQRRTMRLSEK
jgi:hypothetical protein